VLETIRGLLWWRYPQAGKFKSLVMSYI
jgi:hypothetical protein